SYLGGLGNEGAADVVVDAAGNAYLTGGTDSVDFPTANPIQPTRGGATDAFVTKVAAAGSSLAYSTYLGGAGEEDGRAVAADSQGNAYVVGSATTDFPTTAGAFQTAPRGGLEAFVVKVGEQSGGSATSFQVAASAGSVTAGVAFTITVTARPARGGVAPGYRCPGRFARPRLQATLPGNYTCTAADAGVHTFTVTLRTAGGRSVSVTDTVSGSLTGSASVTVVPAAAAALALTGLPPAVTAGSAATVTVTLRDAF